jgi:hypothetical protein
MSGTEHLSTYLFGHLLLNFKRSFTPLFCKILLLWWVFLFCFLQQSHYVAHASLKFWIFLPQPPEDWAQRSAPPCLAWLSVLFACFEGTGV